MLDDITGLYLSRTTERRNCLLVSVIFKLADSGFFKNFLNQDGVRSTVYWVFEDLKFKISEGYD